MLFDPYTAQNHCRLQTPSSIYIVQCGSLLKSRETGRQKGMECNLGLLPGWLGPKNLDHHLVPPWMYISRTLELEAKPA